MTTAEKIYTTWKNHNYTEFGVWFHKNIEDLIQEEISNMKKAYECGRKVDTSSEIPFEQFITSIKTKK